MSFKKFAQMLTLAVPTVAFTTTAVHAHGADDKPHQSVISETGSIASTNSIDLGASRTFDQGSTLFRGDLYSGDYTTMRSPYISYDTGYNAPWVGDRPPLSMQLSVLSGILLGLGWIFSKVRNDLTASKIPSNENLSSQISAEKPKNGLQPNGQSKTLDS